MLRRGALLLLTAVLGVALVAPPASAEPEGGPGRPHPPRFPTGGTFEGTGSYELGTVCPFAWEVIHGTFDGSRRPGDDGTFTLDYCVGFDLATLTGSFGVTTASGVTLSGTAAGSLDLIGSEPPGSPFEFTLTVTGSSGTRRPVTGTISLTGLRTEPGGGRSAVTGTFTTALRM